MTSTFRSVWSTLILTRSSIGLTNSAPVRSENDRSLKWANFTLLNSCTRLRGEFYDGEFDLMLAEATSTNRPSRDAFRAICQESISSSTCSIATT